MYKQSCLIIMAVHLLITNYRKRLEPNATFNKQFFLGLHNPLDALYHLQPFMTLTLIPLVFYIEGEFFSDKNNDGLIIVHVQIHCFVWC